MILNVSGRTDIVAFYTEWFMKRYHEGFVDVRNPFYPKQISRINFSNVDLILFCTKNPLPIINRLSEIDKKIIFHVTITPYKEDIEPNVISKKEIIRGVKKIADIIGKENVFIRYDPIFLNDKYTVNYHIKAFQKLCTLLDGYTNSIIVSFMDRYKNVERNYKILRPREFKEEDYKQIGLNFKRIADEHHMSVQTCAEEHDLCEYGFIKRDCMTLDLAFKITGKTKFKKGNVRKNCNCIEMVDIGAYNTCRHFCKYCYANYDEGKVDINNKKHNPNSTLLIGKIEDNDIIKERR